MWTYIATIAAIAVVGLASYWLLRPTRKRTLNPQGKAYFITGAASGIGLSATKHLATLGCTIFAADLNFDALQKHFGATANIVPIKLNVTSKEDIEEAVKIVQSKVKVLHGIINSAGVPYAPRYPKSWVQGVIELDVDEYVKPVFDINVLGTMRINTALFPLLWEARGSTIINIASMGGLVAAPGMGPYCSSKFAIVGYSDALRRELAPYRIRVVCLEPGFLRTELAQNIFTSITLDYSHTKLFAGRGERDSGIKVEDLPSPDIVTTEIDRILFIDHDIPIPHLLIDTAKMLFSWNIGIRLPHTWMDKKFEVDDSRKRKVDAFWALNPPQQQQH